MEKRGKTCRNFPELTNIVGNGTCFADNLIIPVSGLMLQEEALIISKRLGEDSVDFTRYNINEMKVAEEETLSSWDERSRELMRAYEPRNVWNMDETGQFWRALPDKSLSERRKRCRGGKNSRERAFFVSASGENEAPFVVGKSRNPCCFKSLKDSSRPYKGDYFSSSKAWMSSDSKDSIEAKPTNEARGPPHTPVS